MCLLVIAVFAPRYVVSMSAAPGVSSLFFLLSSSAKGERVCVILSAHTGYNAFADGFFLFSLR